MRRYRYRLNEMAFIGKDMFRDYDAWDIFSSDYYIVQNDRGYNLLDRDGRLVSPIWFKEISKDGDGLVVKTDGGQEVSISSDEISGESLQAIGDIEKVLPSGVSFEDVIYISEPFEMSVKGKKVRILAKVVDYDGRELYLSDEGKLYDKSGKEIHFGGYVPSGDERWSRRSPYSWYINTLDVSRPMKSWEDYDSIDTIQYGRYFGTIEDALSDAREYAKASHLDNIGIAVVFYKSDPTIDEWCYNEDVFWGCLIDGHFYS